MVSTREWTPSLSIAELPVKAAATNLTTAMARLAVLAGPIPKFCFVSLRADVHDCAEARKEAYKLGKLRPGMVLTVEPGLYFQTDDLTVPARYRGIGVRIEDDVVVTGDVCRNLSADFPSAAADVESWMRGIWRSDEVPSAPRCNRPDH